MTVIESELKVIKQNSLDFHIRLEVAGANLIIENMDIDVELIKTRASEPNESSITIWNISYDTLLRLINDMYAVDVYAWYGDNEPALMFRGYINPKNVTKMNAVAGRINTAKGFLASTVKQDNKGQFDIPTVIQLIDSKINYIQHEALRFGDNVLQHTVSANNDFPEQAWADTLFMAAFLLLRVGVFKKDEDMINDALNQWY